MVKLSFSAFEKILKNSSKGIRVSDKATEEFMEFIYEISSKIAKEAAELARHANRKTILKEDIRFVIKKFKE